MASSFERQAGGQRKKGFVHAPGQGREDIGEESQWHPGKTCWVGQFGVEIRRIHKWHPLVNWHRSTTSETRGVPGQRMVARS